MTKIIPSRVLLDLYGEPYSTGRIADRAKRKELALLLDKAEASSVGERNSLMEEFHEAKMAAEEKLTLGMVIVRAMETPLEGDDKVTADGKTERMMLCIDIARAAKGQRVELKPEKVVMIKERVARSVTNSTIVGQVVRLLEGEDIDALLPDREGTEFAQENTE